VFDGPAVLDESSDSPTSRSTEVVAAAFSQARDRLGRCAYFVSSRGRGNFVPGSAERTHPMAVP